VADATSFGYAIRTGLFSGTSRINNIEAQVRHLTEAVPVIVTDTRFAGGADPTGVNDSTVAIQLAVNAAAAAAGGANVHSRAVVVFPAGTYKITTSACLTPTSGTNLAGIHFQGAGWFTSVIRYGTLSASTWLYDNGATARSYFNTFADLGFEGADPATVSINTDVSTNANGFKITSAGNEQGFKFDRCRFAYFDTVFDMEGTNTASEMKFVNCKFHHIRSTLYKLNNVQSFNHEFYGCDAEVIWGDVFAVTGNGGGAIKVYGGSWIMSAAAITEQYFVKVTGTTGAGAHPFIFSGIRFEFRGEHNNIVSVASTQQVNLDFQDCMVGGFNGAADRENFCLIGAYATVTFGRCSFYEADGRLMKFKINTSTLYGQTGAIIFDQCALGADWSERCSLTGFYGKIAAINCYGLDPAAPGTGVHYAHDFDMWWDAATAGQVGVWAGISPQRPRRPRLLPLPLPHERTQEERLGRGGPAAQDRGSETPRDPVLLLHDLLGLGGDRG
jgi:hypothetical protein